MKYQKEKYHNKGYQQYLYEYLLYWISFQSLLQKNISSIIKNIVGYVGYFNSVVCFCYLFNYVREIDGLHIILSTLKILYSVLKIKRFIDFRQIYMCNYTHNAALSNKRPNSKYNVQKLFTFNRKLFFDIEQHMFVIFSFNRRSNFSATSKFLKQCSRLQQLKIKGVEYNTKIEKEPIQINVVV